VSRRINFTKTWLDRVPIAVDESGNPLRLDYYDAAVAGLVLRVGPGGKVFVVRYRTPTGRRRAVTLGAYGRKLTLDQARTRAREILVEADRGGDPAADKRAARGAPTVADLADRYLLEHAEAKKKPSSVAADRTNLNRHVLPALGHLKVLEVTAAEVANLHASIGRRQVRGRKTTGAANRVLALVSKMFSLAERWGWRPQNSNPAKGLERFRERRNERFLNPAEYARLAKALEDTAEADDTTPREHAALLVITLLRDTGCRCGEVLGLRWRNVDFELGQLHLEDAKAGERRVPIGPGVLDVLRDLDGSHAPAAWVFADPHDPASALSYDSLDRTWRRLRVIADLDGVRLHDLRHSHASAAARAGLSLPMIGALLGHRTPATTARYAHLVDDPVAEAARLVERTIAGAPKPRAARKRRA
jgi:integrase